MKLILKDFQDDAVADLAQKLRRAARDAREGEIQSVALSSPTGSGKTVMAAAAIETLLQGDDRYGPNPDATFLWITDQPELNEQTRRKMLEASSALGPSNVVVIDSSFDQETFSPGTLYFLNTQKLGRGNNLVTPGDSRTFTLWETVTNTVNARPGSFYVFIDEAHRGMAESAAKQKEATTIIQKFIKGSPGEIPEVPLVAGISATLARFQRLIEGTGRTARSVDVSPEDVRSSGLLKETVTFFHPSEGQPSDMTMLRAAARSWRDFSGRWNGYCQVEDELPIHPILVVQVQDASGKQISKTSIAEAINAIEEEAGPLDNAAFAHSFQDGGRLEVGGRELRYLAPADIEADPDVQVVFFKAALNTGWDCPRAEVMMSFRPAKDETLIAQLVGRMVRTPLARRIDSDEYLNTVALYLPHYDEAGLTKVVDRLTKEDPYTLPPVKIEKGEDMLTLDRAGDGDEAFAALEKLPSYVVPRPRKTSEVRRLMKLSRLLANDDIDPDGPEKATDVLLGVLRAEHGRLQDTDQFRNAVDEKGKLEIRAVEWRMWTDLGDEAETIELDISDENTDDLFDAAGRKLGEGLHKAWWKARVKEEPEARKKAKLELFALCNDLAVLKKIESTAQATVQQWLKNHNAAITTLTEASKQAYNEIRRLAADPEPAPLAYPGTIEGKSAEKTWQKHLYVDKASLFPAKFNKWETKVIETEIAREDVVGWLRNPERKDWSLCVPYRLGGRQRPLYPDFLVVRSTANGLVVDLLDPHLLSLEDAPAKAAGLADYADKHWPEFGRIELIIVENDEVKRLDLTDEQTRNKVKDVQAHGHLRQLYESG
ncbi:MAG: DEAD/DEAH box helicase family protein [Rubrobacter sp.]|nr:DEAD/DEAH box helicase family protein [Rubrobacter sp.]